MIGVAVIGASGYAGAEIVRILANHREADIRYLGANTKKGQTFGSLFPCYGPCGSMVMGADDPDLYLSRADVVFLALPHGLSVPHVRAVLAAEKKVIDLGADFRFRDVDVYEAWYGVTHEAREISEKAVYGLPELHRSRIPGESLIANPGCYPTGATLALYPLVEAGLVDLDTIIVDSKSGISGAGRGLKDGSLYCEAAESIKPYGVAGHRHTPEIEQNLSEAAGKAVTLTFTPHLVPMSRGILTTAYAKLNEKGLAADIGAIYEEAYGGEYFVRLLPRGQWPQTKWVQGTNFAVIGHTVDRRTGRVVVSSAIDNLGKGAAGQAVQNMNLLFGLDENEGLRQMPLFP